MTFATTSLPIASSSPLSCVSDQSARIPRSVSPTVKLGLSSLTFWNTAFRQVEYAAASSRLSLMRATISLVIKGNQGVIK